MKKTALLTLVAGLAFSAQAGHWGGSRTLPVHRIPLRDEAGVSIASTVENAMPMSAKQTCGMCHDYDKIHAGWHFNAGAAGVDDGRPGEPWIMLDEKFGTQLPVGKRDWPGLYALEDAGLTAWSFTKRFGSHLPGGGISDPGEQMDDPSARWTISGGLEINCFACHNGSARHDMSEWAKQIGRENFRWAATASAGFGEVGGMAARMPDWWNVYAGGNPDDHIYAVPPSVAYNADLFDSRHRMWFEIEKPSDAACLHCHSVHEVDQKREDVAGDVHGAGGLRCVQCHNNGLNHAITRGVSHEAMSCEACHLEEGHTPGKLGAPIAHHKGIPPIHFREMSCTACHSGAVPASEPKVVRTSRANRLGVYGRAQWFTDSPFIVEPVFVRNEAGVIEPRRMMWPAFWGMVEGKEIKPLGLEQVESAAKGVLDADRQVGAVLGALNGAASALGEANFVVGGQAYRRNVDGGLDIAGPVDTKTSWVWRTESNVVSCIPDFDVNAAELDYDAEDAILGVMDALSTIASGRKVVVASKGKVFSRGEDGYLAGAATEAADGWFWQDGETLLPLVPELAGRSVKDTVGSSCSLNEDQVVLMLKKLAASLDAEVAYIANGRKFSLSSDGTLAAEDHSAAEPVSWALGHDVRPAATALGARSCKDCHSPKSDFFFGTVTATGPLKTDRADVTEMVEYQDAEKGFNKLFGVSFLVRKYFKMAMAAFAGLLLIVVSAVGLSAALRAMEQLQGDAPRVVLRLLVLVLALCLVMLAVTGFGFGWPLHEVLSGFALLAHVGCGAAYAAMLCVWAALTARSSRSGLGRWCFWMLVVGGIILILSVLVAMFPLFGTHGQHLCVVVHRLAAIVTIVAAVGGCGSALKSAK